MSLRAEISATVSLEFRFPELQARLREPSQRTPMAMPEASVDENGKTSPEEANVRATRHRSGLFSIPIPHPMDQTPHDELGAGIPTSDEAHASAAFGGREGIHMVYLAVSSLVGGVSNAATAFDPFRLSARKNRIAYAAIHDRLRSCFVALSWRAARSSGNKGTLIRFAFIGRFTCSIVMQLAAHGKGMNEAEVARQLNSVWIF
jgi:hypothetical protein